MEAPPPPRFAVITDDNRGPLVNIAAWILMVSMILSVIAKLAIKMGMTGRVGTEDGLVIGAMVFTALPQKNAIPPAQF